MPASRHAVAPVSAADEIPRWFVWASLALVAGPSFYALAWFQHRLFADLLPGAPGALTYGLAVAVDSFGIVGGVYWFRSRRNEQLRAWGRTFAVAAVIGSTVLTCWAINRMTGGTATALGAIPAIIVFGTTKLVTMWQADRAGNRDVLAEAAAQVAAAELDRDRAAEQHAVDIEALRAELDDVRAQLAAAPPVGLRLVPVVPESDEVRAQSDAPTGPVPVVTADGLPAVEQVADWVRARRGATPAEPDGQRPAAAAFGISRTKIADVHRAALALVDAETTTDPVSVDEPVTAAAGG